jgi:polyhydroxybutyrate depolymerase
MMKKTSNLLLLLLLICTTSTAQWTNKTMSFGGNTRQYRVYLPAGYNTATVYPLVLTLHGLGDNMNNFSAIGMNTVADTAKFIVVVPQAMTEPLLGLTAWNSGAGWLGLYPNAAIDDVAFLKALMDTVSAGYLINQNRIYVCGFSMGGYMTQRLGCELGYKIAAIASVSGTIGNGLGACNPARVLPVLHIHGTNDETVPYANNNSGIDVDSLIRFWVQKNNCNPVPAHVVMPDIANDGFTVDHYTYTGGGPDAVVEHFKVNNGGHTWLKQFNDIDYSIEIWRFFSRYQLSLPTGISNLEDNPAIHIYPNPVRGLLNLETPFTAARLRLYTVSGKIILEKEIKGNVQLSVGDISNGIYFLSLLTADHTYFRKIIIEK